MSQYFSRDMEYRWRDKDILNNRTRDTIKLTTKGWDSLSILAMIIISLCRRNRSIVAMFQLSNSTQEYSLYNSLLLVRQTLASLVKVLSSAHLSNNNVTIPINHSNKRCTILIRTRMCKIQMHQTLEFNR